MGLYSRHVQESKYTHQTKVVNKDELMREHTYINMYTFKLQNCNKSI